MTSKSNDRCMIFFMTLAPRYFFCSLILPPPPWQPSSATSIARSAKDAHHSEHSLSFSSSLNFSAALPRPTCHFSLLTRVCWKVLIFPSIMKAVEMQQPGPIFPVMQSFPPTNITTEQIQKHLDENKKLILAILDNQNLGKLAECAQYQAQLQKNLMYLAAIADAQPQTSAMPPQMTPHPAMQQGAFYMPHPQAATMAQQAGIFPTRASFNSPQPIQELRQQLPQPPPLPHATQAYVDATNGMHPAVPAQTEANLGGSRSIQSSKFGPTDARGVNKQDKPVTGATARSDVKGSSNVAHGSSDGPEAK